MKVWRPFKLRVRSRGRLYREGYLTVFHTLKLYEGLLCREYWLKVFNKRKTLCIISIHRRLSEELPCTEVPIIQRRHSDSILYINEFLQVIWIDKTYLYREDSLNVFYIEKSLCSSSIQKTVNVGSLYRFESLKLFCTEKKVFNTENPLLKSSLQRGLSEGFIYREVSLIHRKGLPKEKTIGRPSIERRPSEGIQ